MSAQEMVAGSATQARAMTARVCLVIAYYEEGQGAVDSLNSVRLEPGDSIVVVDDGSKRLPARDFIPKRVGEVPVILVELPQNRGIAAALQAGVMHAPPQAEYIARLDCRDICVEDRFLVQRRHLDAHPECGIVGSSVVFHDLKGKVLYTHHQPETHERIRASMRINCAFTHPTVMFRRSVYDAAGGYSEDFPHGEDFALFRAMIQLSQGYNISRPLVACATMDGGISERHRHRQLLTRAKIILRHWDWHPGSVYGLVRALAQQLTSRNFTSRVKKVLARFERRR